MPLLEDSKQNVPREDWENTKLRHNVNIRPRHRERPRKSQNSTIE
jgi:hypothetical protein